MSYVSFTSRNAEAQLRGSEHAYLGNMVKDLAVAILNPHWTDDHLRTLIVPGHYLAVPPAERFPGHLQWVNSFTTAWSVEGPSWMAFEGHSLNPFTISLNTAALLGSDQIKVAAWIAGQAEVHGYVEEPYRRWLADIMRSGLDAGVYRKDQDWEDVIDLLRNGDGGPVVMSYSVMDGFPSHDALTEEERGSFGDDGEAFYELSEDEKWEMGLRYLRSDEAHIGALSPRSIKDRHYGTNVTAFDLLDDDRLRAVLSPAEPSLTGPG